jgi:predicted AAA+ superfamily ATPase
LANDCGIDVRTAQHWLSILQASYIVFLLQPHFQNFNKRMIKTPKLYFYDAGLACSLLGITTLEQLDTCYMR